MYSSMSLGVLNLFMNAWTFIIAVVPMVFQKFWVLPVAYVRGENGWVGSRVGR